MKKHISVIICLFFCLLLVSCNMLENYSDMPPTERTDNDGPISIFVNQSKMCFQDNANKYSNEELIVYNYSGESIDASEIRL